MAGKNTAVFGIYKSRAQAESAVDRILAAGFSQNDISVLLPDSQSSKEFAHEKNTKAPEGTTTGVTTGGIVGTIISLNDTTLVLRVKPEHQGSRERPLLRVADACYSPSPSRLV